jgi:cellulose synthase operon protein C
MRVEPRGWLALLLVALLLPGPACAQQDGRTAEAALREGRYDEAIRIAEAATRADPGDESARRALARALLEVGRYDDLIDALPTLHNLRGEALRARGRLAEAEAAFEAAIDEPGPDLATAELNLAELYHLRGDRDGALTRFDAFIDLYNRTPSLSSEELTAVGNAVWYLGATEPELFRDAVQAFDEAITADPANVEPHVRLGELFLEKYNSPEARQAFNDALQINPRHARALLGLARAAAFDGNRGDAQELVGRSLEINPNLVAARVFRARLLLDSEDHEGAQEELRRALEVNPASLEALSGLAAVLYLRDDSRGYAEVKARVGQLNPRYGGLLTTVAEIAAQHRRYAEAARLAEEATRLDPQSWHAHGVLGINLFRLGRVDEAMETLERSFAGDPYNVWIKNNLDLLDTFVEYDVRRLPGIEVMLHRDEADVLFPYLADAAVQAHAELSQRYGDQPRGDIRIELYPRSADFSVRTVGLAGLGALGVSFGDVLALDSPAARTPGSYNWLVTLWHELAHAITLGVSNNRVPRWLTEGISVFEERRARPGWTPAISPEFILAYDAGELPPVSRLNDGFVRPRTPQHLGLAYAMGSLVVEWIEETRGFDALLRMLHGYRDGRATEEIFRSVLRAEPEAIDRDFDTWLRGRASPERAREFGRILAAGRRQLDAGDLADARRSLEAAAALFPVSSAGSPYALLAQLHLRQGDERAAADALVELTRYDEHAYAANLELARLLESLGDERGAAEALERAVWMNPFDLAPHIRLAELYGRLGEHARAVRERRVIVGLRPTDRADAHYQLAVALLAAGEREDARREVLRALEVAPGFDAAQQLLLRLHEAP